MLFCGLVDDVFDLLYDSSFDINENMSPMHTKYMSQLVKGRIHCDYSCTMNWALRHNDINTVLYIFDMGFPFNREISVPYMLYSTIQSKNTDLLEYIFNMGFVSADSINYNVINSLYSHGTCGMINFFVERNFDVEINKIKSFRVATYYCNVDVIEYLVDANKDTVNINALFQNIINKDNSTLSMIKLMFAKGITIENVTYDNLRCLVTSKRLGTLRYLISKGLSRDLLKLNNNELLLISFVYSPGITQLLLKNITVEELLERDGRLLKEIKKLDDKKLKRYLSIMNIDKHEYDNL
jgi:hypothetical protein